MSAQSFLMMIPKGDEEKKPGQERYDDNADRSAGEQFEVKMIRTKEPRGTSTENTSTYLGRRRCIDLGHYKFHKKQIACHSLRAGLCNPESPL